MAETSADLSGVDTVLDTLHRAASVADGDTYFALFAPEGVFIGTDARERWTVDAFKSYAMPRFSRGKGWTYIKKERHVDFSPAGDVAWFDEILAHASFGVCRGSGVLRRIGNHWKISQYHLTIPVPNELVTETIAMIRKH